jgi:hypothetical protein
MQQLGQLKQLATGLPMTDVTTTQQAAPPTAFGQLAGLGLAGVGAAGAAGAFNSPTTVPKVKKGGVIKKYASGGLVDLSLYNTLKGQA